MSKFKNFYERMEDAPITSKLDVVSKTVQGKAMNVQQVMKRINAGVSTEADLFRRLPDDKQGFDTFKDGSDIDGTDYVDLAIAKQRMQVLKERASKDDEKTKKTLKKKAAEESSVASEGSPDNNNED